jgi:hypothetical protein
VIGVIHVADGFHYPPDIGAGINLRVGAAELVERLPFQNRMMQSMTRRLSSKQMCWDITYSPSPSISMGYRYTSNLGHTHDTIDPNSH